MSKKITKEDVKRVAQLANIKLTDAELEKFAPQIESILEYVSKLSELDVEGKEFKSQTQLNNVFRKDEPGKSLSNEEAIQNRKNTSKAGYVVVKSVLDK